MILKYYTFEIFIIIIIIITTSDRTWCYPRRIPRVSFYR